MPPSPPAPTRTRSGVADKRTALLDSALELFAENGLQSVPTAAIARKAGVAKGTLFVYFPTKEQLLNELYLDVAADYVASMQAAIDAGAARDDRTRTFWFAFARWHLDHRAAATVVLQCELSSVLTPETQAKKAEMEAQMARTFFPNLDKWMDGSVSRHLGYALLAGPIEVLAQLRDKGELEVTEALLEQTFVHVEKALHSLHAAQPEHLSPSPRP